MGDSVEAKCKQTGDVYNSDKIVNNVEILVQSSADFVLTYNFQGSHILGASCGHLCDSSVFLLYYVCLTEYFLEAFNVCVTQRVV